MNLNRRQFLRTSAVSALATTVYGYRGRARAASPNEQLNLGIVGVGGQGAFSINQLAKENLAALCDIDDTRLAEAGQRFPSAQRYQDFRRLIDQKDLDAIVVATPDHTHAVASVAALRSGRHLYCEKPLTRTVSEARIVTETARATGRVTQIGTQIHAGTNYRRVVELIQSGALGRVGEVHVWVGATYGGKQRPTDTPPVPPHVHYDLWLGPVAHRPYHPEYLPFGWRNWWAFAGGALADFGCHFMDLPFWALDLSTPLTVEPVDGPPVDAECPPPWAIVRYQFGARAALPPVTLTWYHGGKLPPGLDPEQQQYFRSGVLFVGERGRLLADYTRRQLLPAQEFEGFKPPTPFIPDSIGHHAEWVQAIKTGGRTTCHFGYSGPLTEAALLGNVAYRLGRKLEWDAVALKARGCPEADLFLQHRYREGWSL